MARGQQRLAGRRQEESLVRGSGVCFGLPFWITAAARSAGNKRRLGDVGGMQGTKVRVQSSCTRLLQKHHCGRELETAKIVRYVVQVRMGGRTKIPAQLDIRRQLASSSTK